MENYKNTFLLYRLLGKNNNSKQKQKNENKTLVKSKEEPRYIPKPIDIEQAAEIMENDKLSFLVFRNLKTERKNITAHKTNDKRYLPRPKAQT